MSALSTFRLLTSRPFLNHLTNGLAFDGAGRLFIAQGSSSDAGVVDPPGMQEFWPETPLSAAILVADIHAPGFDGDVTYDPPGEPAGDDVDQVRGDVAVFAPGLRNPFDLVIHSNGFIYATDNGAMQKAVSLSCVDDGDRSSPADELNLIERGNYYGAPNRNRGRSDPRQCAYHAPEDGSGSDFTGPIAILPDHCSCDGIVEYRAAAFGGDMLGDLLYTEWSRGRVSRAKLSEDGRSVVSISAVGTGLDAPLDLTIAPDGTIYVAEYGGDSIAYLSPNISPLPTASPAPTITPTATGALPATATPTSTAAATATPTSPAAATPTPAGTPSALLGDANCSGNVDSIDAALILQLTAALIDSLPCPEGGDASGDGNTNAVDAALILQLEAGIIDGLPP